MTPIVFTADAVPTIRALRDKAARIRLQTLTEARQVTALRGADAALEYLAATLSNRLMHTPTVRLREAAARNEIGLVADAVELFALDPKDDYSRSEAA